MHFICANLPRRSPRWLRSGCRPSVRTGDGVSRPQGCRQAQPARSLPALQVSTTHAHANPSLMWSRYAVFQAYFSVQRQNARVHFVLHSLTYQIKPILCTNNHILYEFSLFKWASAFEKLLSHIKIHSKSEGERVPIWNTKYANLPLVCVDLDTRKLMLTSV